MPPLSKNTSARVVPALLALVPRKVALTLVRAAVAPGSALSQNVSTALAAVAAGMVSVTWLLATAAAKAPPTCTMSDAPSTRP